MIDFIKSRLGRNNGIFIPIATKLILTYLLIIVIISAFFMLVGVRLISDRIISEAQDKVRNDLNAAREIYLSELTHINDVVRLTAAPLVVERRKPHRQRSPPRNAQRRRPIDRKCSPSAGRTGPDASDRSECRL